MHMRGAAGGQPEAYRGWYLRGAALLPPLRPREPRVVIGAAAHSGAGRRVWELALLMRQVRSDQ